MRLNFIDNCDCLEGLAKIPDGSVDLIVTDPPYSSGGAFAGDRRSNTGTKYIRGKTEGAALCQDFSGDNMDQLGFMEFTRQVFAKCREKTKPEGVIAVFIDWRNLPALCNSLQAAGWVWRGIAIWHKSSARPSMGRYRNDAEYIVWGSNGPMPFERGVGCLPGVYKYPPVASKRRQHQTEKPLQLIEDLLQIIPEGCTVLDPFMGCGTTAAACIRTGRNYIGYELSPEYHAIALQRIAEEAQSLAPVPTNEDDWMA